MACLFVYGSLLSGMPNHGVLTGARRLGLRLTAPRYRLVDLGPYPALLERGSTTVAGELYEVSNAHLGRLDAFEGHPDLYRRSAVDLLGGDEAEAYFLARLDLAAGARIVVSGDWRQDSAATARR